MKNVIRLSATLILVITFMASCSTTADSNYISVTEAENIIPGSYKVNTFEDAAGASVAYESYIFSFKSNGTLEATSGVDTCTGQWAINGVNDANYEMEMTLTINGNTEVEYLSHNWFVEEITDVTLMLIDDSGIESIYMIKN